MKLTITNMLGLFALLPLLGCGAVLDSGSVMRVEMYGTLSIPDSASGDSNPSFQSYVLKQIALTTAGGATTLVDTEESFKIIDRAQLLFEKDMSNFEGNDYTGISVSFDPEVVGGNAKQPELTFTLNNPQLTYTQAFSIEAAKTITFTIQAHWGNTLADGVMTEPEFEINGP